MNILIATGNLGQDATQRFSKTGDSIVSISLPIKSGFGDNAKTSWVRCTIFGKRGDSVLPYLKKGTLVGVSGEFSMNEWTNKEGQKVTSPECRVAELTLLGGKPAQVTEPARQQARPAPVSESFAGTDDDIPF